MRGDGFMPMSEAKVKANKKYREKFEYIQARVPAEEKAIVTAHAEAMGESLNAFVRRAIAEAIERDRAKNQSPDSHDPFYSPSHTAHLLHAVQALNNGEGKPHELVEED
jgi:hypothetical protein